MPLLPGWRVVRGKCSQKRRWIPVFYFKKFSFFNPFILPEVAYKMLAVRSSFFTVFFPDNLPPWSLIKKCNKKWRKNFKFIFMLTSSVDSSSTLWQPRICHWKHYTTWANWQQQKKKQKSLRNYFSSQLFITDISHYQVILIKRNFVLNFTGGSFPWP